jgi:hypothetical protein
MNKLSLVALGALCLAAMPACVFSSETFGPTGSSQPPLASSSTLATDQLSPSFSAQDYGDGSGLHVYAALLGPNGNFVQLTGSDSLSATDGSQVLPMTIEQASDGTQHYTATFPSSTTTSAITVSFNRVGAGSATGSSTVVAAPFTVVTAPPPYLAAGHYTISVSPTPTAVVEGSGESWQITASGDCIPDFIASTTDQSLSLNAKEELVFDASQLALSSSGSCPITVLVRHEQYGPDDPTFAAPVLDDSVAVDNAPFGKTWSFEGVQARSWDTSLSSQ